MQGSISELCICLPGDAEITDEVARSGRDFVIQGELLRVWLVLNRPGMSQEQLEALEVFVFFEEENKTQISDMELGDRKPRHVPSGQTGTGWSRHQLPSGKSVLSNDIPVLLRSDLQSLVLRASVKSPVFAAPPSLNDLEEQLLSASYMERRIVPLESCLRVRLVAPLHLDLRAAFSLSHATEFVLTMTNTSELLLRFHHISLSEGSVRYNGPAGVQAVSMADLFVVHVTQERDASLEPGDVAAVSVRLRPKPLAFVQFTDWEGSFSGRAVVGWSAPGVMCGGVCSSVDMSWKGPRSGGLLVQCESGSACCREPFFARVTVNNVSDVVLTLTLTCDSTPTLVCLDRAVVLGTLSPKSKISVAVRFVGLCSGVQTVGEVRIFDQQGDSHHLQEPWTFLIN